MSFSKLSLARRLRLQQLAIFDTVVATGSLLAASRELHMTQPALTKAVQELEEHMEQALFVRTRRGVELTDFGRMMHGHCRSLLAGVRLLADDLNAWKAGVSGQVIVGSLLVASARLLPKALVRLRALAPDVVVEVRVGGNEAMFEALVRGELDVMVGLLPAQPGDPALEHVPLFEEKLCAVVGRHHPLASEVAPALAQLEHYDWILPTPESDAMPAALRFFEALGMKRPVRVIESVSILTNLGLLIQSEMIGVMPFSVARQFVQGGLLSVLPLGHGSVFGTIGYTLCKGREPSPAAERLLQALREAAEP
ncbi:hypothetical protein BKK79_23900 [Cupriavidus sp. USMAA2-4]|uniref:HTH lysR-type domain-containing protein n=1 Tax=Cupriavidus malaysiensis TaxID=367825 RepID=A0ABN4TV96_9BURK|nr:MULTISPECIES: LysR substrate-binding domain-containing protein [Cupriavidus]AOY94905.1 hypothetical protein BKK79_23900 [Cupriavidus sp. USMAA2-4]AOZ02217.1 hypothetical protein BKK81_23300 [Cupriavidus sp. USMAHM13]AOZ10404.1 hypothetical protein BKK80_33015 [Cupriavidus malaysiensis]